MTVKIGISGFGRIGRCTFRTALSQPDVEIAAINNRSVGPIMADLLKFDTVHGTWRHDVSYDTEKSMLVVDGKAIPVTTFPGKIWVSILLSSRRESSRITSRPPSIWPAAPGKSSLRRPARMWIRRLSWASMKKRMIPQSTILFPTVHVRQTAWRPLPRCCPANSALSAV